MMKLATKLNNRYELIQDIGAKSRQQTARKTFIGWDSQTQERVVVKIVQLASDSWTDLKLFEREAQALASLNHPAIPQYKDMFETEIEGKNSFVLVQTCIEAASLETLIQSGRRFSVVEIKEIAEHLLTVLSYLHGQTPPVIHRDIKPSNILLGQSVDHADSQLQETDSTNNPNIYLIDFGAVHTDLTKEDGTITIVGSYGYIPLEQFSGHATPASDLYSLGMTLIYLMTGTHPAELVHVDGKVQLPHHTLDPSLVQWLERMTAPYLHQRFDAAQQALLSLRSRQSSQGHYRHLKPNGTPIELTRARDRLIITIPEPKPIPSEMFMNTAIVLLFCGSFLLAIFYSSIAPLPVAALFGPAIFFLCVFLCLLGGLTSKLIEHIKALVRRLFNRLPTPKQQTIIEIDFNTGIRAGTRTHPQAAISWQTQTHCYADIDLVTYTPGYKFAPYTTGDEQVKQLGGGVPPELSVHAKDVHYPIGHSQLSPAEFWWLGQEISDFLGLELQTIYPMPIVDISAASTCGCGC
ncbi:MAG: serine/threonine-protein kinase [Cyanobacteria bacterium J06559_1]